MPEPKRSTSFSKEINVGEQAGNSLDQTAGLKSEFQRAEQSKVRIERSEDRETPRTTSFAKQVSLSERKGPLDRLARLEKAFQRAQELRHANENQSSKERPVAERTQKNGSQMVRNDSLRNELRPADKAIREEPDRASYARRLSEERQRENSKIEKARQLAENLKVRKGHENPVQSMDGKDKRDRSRD